MIYVNPFFRKSSIWNRLIHCNNQNYRVQFRRNISRLVYVSLFHLITATISIIGTIIIFMFISTIIIIITITISAIPTTLIIIIADIISVIRTTIIITITINTSRIFNATNFGLFIPKSRSL